ncbi:MAG: alpha/beta fold hydrolase [Phycisphaerae bacterium]
MLSSGWLIAGLGAGALIFGIVVALIPRMGVRAPSPGDPAEGVAIFCGGLRWFGLRWGLRSVPEGLRKAGFRGRVIYWPWHEGWRLWNTPVLWDAALHERQTRRIAAYINAFRQKYPDSPVHLLGCSAGGWIAAKAVERLPEELRIQSLTLLSAAVDPQRDLSNVLSHLDGVLLNCSSYCDFIILGAGTILFGTGDRRHTASCGLMGFAGPSAQDSRVEELRWSPRMVLSGRYGGHASATPPGFIARYVAPRILHRRPDPRGN